MIDPAQLEFRFRPPRVFFDDDTGATWALRRAAVLMNEHLAHLIRYFIGKI